MQRHVRTLLFLATLCTGMARADTDAVPTGEDWVAAARASLALADRRADAIVVVDDRLAPPALDALRQVRATIHVDELPEREQYELPPGNYLRVSIFAQSGDGIEFQSTTGPIPRNAGRNCGVTKHFFIKRDTEGAWTQDGPTGLTVC